MGCRSSSALAAVLTFSFSAALAHGQTAQELLDQVSASYKALTDFRFAGKKLSETKTHYGASKSEMEFEIAAARPGKIKIAFDYGNGNRWIRVSDGETYQGYRSLTHKVDRRPASPDDARMLHPTILGAYERIGQNVRSATLTGSENVDVGGEKIDCHVVEVQYEPGALLQGAELMPTRYWIDKTRHLVLKQVSGTRSGKGDRATEDTLMTTFTVAEVNRSVPEAVFELAQK